MFGGKKEVNKERKGENARENEMTLETSGVGVGVR